MILYYGLYEELSNCGDGLPRIWKTRLVWSHRTNRITQLRWL